MMIKKRYIIKSALVILIAAGAVAGLWALNDAHNRPNPLMDYVPQTIGIYDTVYSELVEDDCRSCHGNSLADRHHNSGSAGQCTFCHETGGGPITPEHDCTLSGCHSPSDLTDNGWHHNTDESGSGQCNVCHSPGLITVSSPVRDSSIYPITSITPTPFSCENCHWSQQVSGIHPTGTGDSSGSYNKAISGSYDTHHMGDLGNVSSECYTCHADDPEFPSYDPTDRQIIRYCEKCHDINSLHYIRPHVQDSNGWEAVGFHFEGSTDITDLEPSTFRTINSTEKCLGCHADNLPAAPEPPPLSPTIDLTGGIVPNVGVCGVHVTLRGEYFGSVKGLEYDVEVSGAGPWVEMSVISWSDTLIEFAIPCVLFPDGNIDVRVVTPTGMSNTVVFALNDGPSITGTLLPLSGPAGTWVKLDGNSFQSNQTVMFNDDFGVYSIVQLTDSRNTYILSNYQNWSNISIETRIYDHFIDENNNYYRDIETEIYQGEGLYEGNYQLNVKSIFFNDTNPNDTYDEGDTIVQVVNSSPRTFTLTHTPEVWTINPLKVDRNGVIKLYGVHLGTGQGNKEIDYCPVSSPGNYPDLGTPLSVIDWSNTRIRAYADVDVSLEGQSVLVWVYDPYDTGFVTDYIEIEILEPLP